MNFEVKEKVSLADVSTFGIGGPAKEFITVSSPEELVQVARWAKSNSKVYRVIAGGSNVVFPDEGLGCLVIRFLGGEAKVLESERVLIADAGVLLAEVIERAIAFGLSGLETLSGIPGTVGGAVVGNAGAYGHSISEAVQKVEVFDEASGEVKSLSNDECFFGYRESVFKKRDLIVTRIFLKLKEGNRAELEARSREIITVREKKYKPGIKCPGSFFKNVLVKDVSKEVLDKIKKEKIIEGKIPAGYLLEEVGARGMREGGIYIADFHGNLLVNDGTGKAEDVKKLAARLKGMVRERFGIELEEEVRFVSC